MAKYDNWKGLANPPPEAFCSGPPTEDYMNHNNPNDVYYTFPPDGHRKEDNGDFDNALWGVFDGRRK